MSEFMVCTTDVAEDELVMDLHELNQDHASNDEDVRDDEKVDDDMDTYELNTEPHYDKNLEDLKLEDVKQGEVAGHQEEQLLRKKLPANKKRRSPGQTLVGLPLKR